VRDVVTARVGFWKAALLGGLLALLALASGLGVYLYSRGAFGNKPAVNADRVVVVAASPAGDGAMVAHVVAVVAHGRVTRFSPDTTVTIPGTSFRRLGDAYAFGGAPAVARALATSTPSGSVGWVDLPPTSWHELIERAGGVTITVPASVNVFDGVRFTRLSAGTQRLTAGDMATLLMGLESLPATAQAPVRQEFELALLGALAERSGQPPLIKSNLAADDLKGWLTRLSAVSLDSSESVVP
jgi:hypothetical protein